MKFRRSLLVQYLGVLGLFILLAPILNLLIVFVYVIYIPLDFSPQYEPKYTFHEVKETWHQAAENMTPLSDEKKADKLTQLKTKYPESTMFWVDRAGGTRLKLPQSADVPDAWTAPMVVQFMKESVDADPYTVVALLGEKRDDGFIVLQLPRSEFTVPIDPVSTFLTPTVTFFVVVGLNIGLFIFMSWLYFYRIRKRLTMLQSVMQGVEETGNFEMVPVRKDDEVADLERSFNQMSQQLMESREREQAEEQLRRELIANLSHDLRTPLTVIRGHAYSLGQESLSEKGAQSLAVIDDKIRYLGQLIENLLSFSLLTAGKYPYQPEQVDVVRELRTITASWYPVLENEGFEVDVRLSEQTIYWQLDKQWFQRIWDNLFQNVLRYAKEGRYVGISVENNADRTCLVLQDRGPGIGKQATSKGAGIGLSIVALMAKEMNLKWYVRSSETGTTCFICQDSTAGT